MHLLGNGFSAEMLGLLTSLGKQLGLAIENARLSEEITRKEAARAQLLKQSINAQEEERRRVARELHDQTGQSLIAVIMSLGAASEVLNRGPRRAADMVEETRKVAVQALDSTRELIMGLRPATLDDLGLVPAIRRFAEDLGRRDALEVTVEANRLPRLPGEVEVVLFRVLQECLRNVSRHSHAKHVAVKLSCDGETVTAEVSDDGVGFDLADATSDPETGRGLGILGMGERAALLGGTVAIDSMPDQGTRVRVTVPLSGVAKGKK